MEFDSLVKKIESLPPLIESADLIKRVCAEGVMHTNLSRLIIAIESDALLSLSLLKMANAPLYGFSRTITSVTQAVTLFGAEMIFAFVLRFSINARIMANLRPYGLSNEAFNEVCVLQSRLLTAWYMQVDPLKAPFLASLALIMESGKLLLAREITADGKIKSFCEGLKSASSVVHYEHEIFGTSSYYVTGLLFEHWHLNANYVAILKGLDYEHENFDALQEQIDVLDVVRTAINVNAVLTPDSVEESAAFVAQMGHDPQKFLSAVKKIKLMRNV